MAAKKKQPWNCFVILVILLKWGLVFLFET